MDKEVVILDLDNTLVKGQSQKLFISYLFKRKLFPTWLYFKLLIWFVFYRLGIVKEPEQVMREAFRLFRGHNFSEIESVVDDFFNTVLKNTIFADTENLLEEHKLKRRVLVLATNVLEPIASRIAKFLKIPNILSTKLELIGGVYTGEVEGKIIYGQNKLEALKKFLEENELSHVQKWAYSDHISDISILELADFPSAVNPDPKLFQEARRRGWPILLFKKTI
ncbi:MAG: HAD-IB family hydrolase [Candidatus Giovannonibacteria bacterium]|nr:HAD-IB family hydrolase [Candidatus Giovannonibacteria bacterium]